MKKLGKPFSAILIFLILVFSIISIFGFSYYVGDNKTTVIRGFNDLKFGTDINGGVKFAVSPSSADEAGEIADIIEKRATYYGIKDYELYIQDESKDVVLVLPNDLQSVYDAEETAAFLTSRGYVSIRPGYSFTEAIVDSAQGPAFITPTDETAATILINSDYIVDASVSEYKDGDGTFYTVDVQLNDEGSALISQISNPNGGAGDSYYNEVVSLWLDDRMVAFRVLDEHIDSGVISFVDDNLTKGKAELCASLIKFGDLPGIVRLSELKSVDSLSGESIADMLFVLGIILFIALAFVLIYRYRAGGGIILVSLLFQMSVLLAVFTKFFDKKQPFLMNIPAFAAYGLSMLLTAFSLSMVFEKIKESLNSGIKLSACITDSFVSTRTRIFDINIVFVLISVSALIIFGTNGFATTLFGYSLCAGVYRFCDVMLFGSILNFISGYILPFFITNNITEYKFLKKPSMMGGNK